MAGPLTNPILVLALLGVLLLVVPLLAQRLRVPATVALILAGVATGPHGLGLLDPGGGLELFATTGLLYIMFLAGLEIDLPEFRFQQHQALFLGLLIFGLAQGAGTAAGLLLGCGWLTALAFGSLFAPQTLVTYPRVSRLGLARDPAVPVTVGAAALANALALLVLVTSVRLATHQLTPLYLLRFGGGLAGLGLAAVVVLPRVGRWFYRRFAHDDVAEFLFMFATLMVMAGLAWWSDVEPVFGALVAGLALNPLVPEQSRLLNRVQFVGNALFIPVFLLSVGMLVDPRALLAGPRVWWLTALLAVGAAGAKYVAVRATRLRFRFSVDQGWLMFGLLVNKASVTLAAALVAAPALVAVGAPLAEHDLLNAMVLVILLTCTVGAAVTERAARRLGAARPGPEQAGVPQRILIPLTEPAAAERLLALALLIRDRDSRQPLFPLGVAQDGPDASRQVADLERLLSQAVVHATAADVPVRPEVRIDGDRAAGIEHAAKELRASCIVLAWPADADTGQERPFGALADSLLRATRGQLLIARLQQPVNTFRRLVLVLPPLLEQLSGFPAALRTLDTLAAQAGMPILVVALRRDLGQRLEELRTLSPGRPVAGMAVEVWSGLPDLLQRRARRDDLLVLCGCRDDSPAWQPALVQLPRLLSARLAKASLVWLFPAECAPAPPAAPGPAPAPALVELETFLRPQQVRLGIRAGDLRTFFQQLLQPYLATGRGAAADQAWLLAEALAGTALEVRRGTVLAHVHCGGLEAPAVLLGTPEGTLAVPGVTGPVQAVFVLLTPLQCPPAEHLRALSDIARLILNAPRLEDIARARSLAELPPLFDPRAGEAAHPPPSAAA